MNETDVAAKPWDKIMPTERVLAHWKHLQDPHAWLLRILTTLIMHRFPLHFLYNSDQTGSAQTISEIGYENAIASELWELKFIRQLQSCEFFLLGTFTVNINYDWYNPDKGGRLWCAPTPTISYGIHNCAPQLGICWSFVHFRIFNPDTH